MHSVAGSSPATLKHSPIAQLAEYEAVNFGVPGSSPGGGASSYSSAVERFVYTENAGGSNPSGSIHQTAK